MPGAGLFFVAQERGFFRQQGLDVVLQSHPTGKLALDSLFNGTADLAIAGDTPLVFSILADRKIEILATVYRPNGGISIIARKDRVTAAGDLKGKRLGATFVSSGQYFAEAFLVVNGIRPGDVTLLDMTQDQIAEALPAGKIDAASVWQPYLVNLQEQLGERGVTFSNNGLYTFGLSMVANRGYAASHRSIITKILDALKMAQRFGTEHPEAAIAVLGQATGIPAAMAGKFFDPAEYKVGLEQGLLLTLEDQTRWLIKRGFAKADKVPNYAEYINADPLRSVNPDAVKILQ